MRWILGSFRKDALFLAVPGLIALAIERAHALETSLMWIFLVSAFADSGHVYTTVWRTWFHSAERQRSAWTFLVPLLVAIVAFTWSWSGLPYMWSFVIYATIHHNWKQFYGMTRWYETLNRHSVRWSGFFSKALMITPVIAYHFRSDATDGFYTEGDVFLFPNQYLLLAATAIYLCLVTLWLAFEVRNYRQGFREPNRFLSIALSSSLYCGSFFFGSNIQEVLFPIVLAHGVGYLAMLSVSLERTRQQKFKSYAKAFAVVAGTALVCGGFEALVEKRVINFKGIANLQESLLIGVYLVPLFSHFIFDRYLWKHTHWEARLVYATPKAAEIVSMPERLNESNQRAV